MTAVVEDQWSPPLEDNPVAKPPIYSIADLAALPKPSYLIDGILPADALAVLYGQSGIGKSFQALDWALCVADGIPWYGKTTKRGAVLYIAAEGAGGLYQRVEAWMTERQQDPPELIRFLPVAVNLLDSVGVGVVKLAIAAMPKPPVLIVQDTMARCMVGGDENSAKDVGRFVAALDSIRRDYGATGLVVHHTGKDGEDERGSSSLRGAADTMLAMKEDGANVRLTCSKMKDAAEFDPWTLHLEPVANSCVLRLGPSGTELSASERKVLEGTSASFGTEPVGPSKLLAELGIPKQSFYRSLKTLTERGFIQRDDSQGRSRYSITPAGQRQLQVPAGTTVPLVPSQEVPRQSPLPLGRAGGTETDPQDLREALRQRPGESYEEWETRAEQSARAPHADDLLASANGRATS